MQKLLVLIRKIEAGKGGYNADFRNDDHWDLSKYTFDQVVQLAKSQVSQGEGSSAIGGYQFLSKTLLSLKADLGLSGQEQFTPQLQDRLAMQLLKRRGLAKYQSGSWTAQQFANELAKEWASFPVQWDQQGAHRFVRAGQSYYAGDGLNKALVSPQTVLAALESSSLPAPSPTPTPVPGTSPHPQEHWFVRFVNFLLEKIFGGK